MKVAVPLLWLNVPPVYRNDPVNVVVAFEARLRVPPVMVVEANIVLAVAVNVPEPGSKNRLVKVVLAAPEGEYVVAAVMLALARESVNALEPNVKSEESSILNVMAPV